MSPRAEDLQKALATCGATKTSPTTVDFRTIGGNAKVPSGYYTTHQIFVAEEVSSKDRSIDLIFLKKAMVYRRSSLVFYLPTAISLVITIALLIDLYTRATI